MLIYPPYSMLVEDYRVGSVELREAYQRALASKDRFDLLPPGREIIDRGSSTYDRAQPAWERLLRSTEGSELSDDAFVRRERLFVRDNADLETRYYESLSPQPFRHASIVVGTHELEWSVKEPSSETTAWQSAAEPVPYERQVNIAALAKERGVSVTSSFEGDFPNTRYFEQRYEQMLLIRRRRSFYKTLCSTPDFEGERFIFLALMFQPERTSCPVGGIFSNQFLIVNMLSHLVPEGSYIYVKEHPTQFHPNIQASQARSDEFYATIARFKNVKLMDTTVNPFALIDKCWAVATIGGTAALEGVIRGKPALIFGHAYYKDCAGMHSVTSEEELRDALSKIARDDRVEIRDVEKYFHAIETTLFKAVADFNLVSEEQEGDAPLLARQICREIERMGLRAQHRQ
jgi:hypothetical protein